MCVDRRSRRWWSVGVNTRVAHLCPPWRGSRTRCRHDASRTIAWVNIVSIHRIEGPSFDGPDVRHLHIGLHAVADVDEGLHYPAQVQQSCTSMAALVERNGAKSRRFNTSPPCCSMIQPRFFRGTNFMTCATIILPTFMLYSRSSKLGAMTDLSAAVQIVGNYQELEALFSVDFEACWPLTNRIALFANL